MPTGRPIYGAFRNDNLVGVAVTFVAGRPPPPRHTFLRFVSSFLAAGPGPSIRALRTSAVMDGAHPNDEHTYLCSSRSTPPASAAAPAGLS